MREDVDPRNIEQTKQLVDDVDKFDELMDNVEKTLRRVADDYDVEVDDEAVTLVQANVAHVMVKFPGEEEEWLDRLHDDFSDPEARVAGNSVSMPIAAGREENESLYQLGGAIIGRNYRAAGDH